MSADRSRVVQAVWDLPATGHGVRDLSAVAYRIRDLSAVEHGVRDLSAVEHGGPGVSGVGPGGRGRSDAVTADLLLVAHGTRDPSGAVATERVAARVRLGLPGVRVAVCFADVRGPTLAQVLEGSRGRACVAVPVFLAAGYHVRVDVPEQVRACGRADVVVAQAFGPDPALVRAGADRLVEAGWRAGDAVVLAVAGSSDPSAQADGDCAARRLGRMLGHPVALATVATGGPRVADVVVALRAVGARRVAVASWLLAPGLFQQRLHDSGADVVAAPLGDHPAVPELVVARYQAALVEVARSA